MCDELANTNRDDTDSDEFESELFHMVEMELFEIEQAFLDVDFSLEE